MTSYRTVKWNQTYESYRMLGTMDLVFEIGVAGGGSLQKLKEIYPDATIVGIDCDPRCRNAADPKNGVHVEIGSVMRPSFLMGLLMKYGSPDLVIDDGGHKAWHHLAAFRVLWSHLKSGGVYVIEDIHTCLNPRYSLIPGGAMWVLLPYLFNRYPVELRSNMMLVHKRPILPHLEVSGDVDCREEVDR